MRFAGIKERQETIRNIADEISCLVTNSPQVLQSGLCKLESTVILLVSKENVIPEDVLQEFKGKNRAKIESEYNALLSVETKSNRPNNDVNMQDVNIQILASSSNTETFTTFKIPKVKKPVDEDENQNVAIDDDLEDVDTQTNDNESNFEVDNLPDTPRNEEMTGGGGDTEKENNASVEDNLEDNENDSSEDLSSFKNNKPGYQLIEEENDLLDFEEDDDEDDDGNFKRKKVEEKVEEKKPASLPVAVTHSLSSEGKTKPQETKNENKIMKSDKSNMESLSRSQPELRRRIDVQRPISELPIKKSNLENTGTEISSRETEVAIEDVTTRLNECGPADAFCLFQNLFRSTNAVQPITSPPVQRLLESIVLKAIMVPRFPRLFDLKKKLIDSRTKNSDFWNKLIADCVNQIRLTKDQLLRTFLQELYFHLLNTDVNVTLRNAQRIRDFGAPRNEKDCNRPCCKGIAFNSSNNSSNNNNNIFQQSQQYNQNRVLSNVNIPVNVGLPTNPGISPIYQNANSMMNPHATVSFHQNLYAQQSTSINPIEEYKNLLTSSQWKRVQDLIVKNVRTPGSDSFVDSFKEALVYEHAGLAFRVKCILDQKPNEGSINSLFDCNEAFTKIITYALQCAYQDKNNINQGLKIIEYINAYNIVLFSQRARDLAKLVVNLCKPDKFIEAAKLVYSMCKAMKETPACVVGKTEKQLLIEYLVDESKTLVELSLRRDFESVERFLFSALMFYDKSFQHYESELKSCFSHYLDFLINDRKRQHIASLWRYINEQLVEPKSINILSPHHIRGMVTVLGVDSDLRECASQIFRYGLLLDVYSFRYKKQDQKNSSETKRVENCYLLEMDSWFTTSEMQWMFLYVVEKILDSNEYAKQLQNLDIEENSSIFDFYILSKKGSYTSGDINFLDVDSSLEASFKRLEYSILRLDLLQLMKEKKVKLNVTLTTKFKCLEIETVVPCKPAYKRPLSCAKLFNDKEGKFSPVEIKTKNADVSDPRREFVTGTLEPHTKRQLESEPVTSVKKIKKLKKTGKRAEIESGDTKTECRSIPTTSLRIRREKAPQECGVDDDVAKKQDFEDLGNLTLTFKDFVPIKIIRTVSGARTVTARSNKIKHISTGKNILQKRLKAKKQ